MPNLALEEECGGLVCGIDEVGRGPLAGPVVAAAVVLDLDHMPRALRRGIDDSKVLSAEEREDYCREIRRCAVIGVGAASVREIDRINILRASKLAMAHAVENLPVRPDILLLDAVLLESIEMPQVPLIEGDRRSISIAAASIVAKVYRDLLMESYHERYPVYDFAHNRGYATEGHQAALKTYGPSPIHRRSFEGVDEPMMLFGDGRDGDSTR